MSVNDLFSGVAVIIDDEIEDKTANINKLISQIEKNKMPCLKYNRIPEDDVIKNWKGISFVLLDWNLNGSSDGNTTRGVKYPEGIKKENIESNIKFLKNFKNICFAPVFIFTNEDIDVVISTLKESKLYKDNKPNYIFIKEKYALTRKNSLFNAMQDWIKHTPPVYVLKVWESEYEKAKTALFHNFYEIDPNWPKIIWKSFSDDGTNVSSGLGEMIVRNLYTRMTPFEFDSNMIKRKNKKRKGNGNESSKKEIRGVFEGERFLRANRIHQDTIAAGDVFKISGKIYLNVRPDCDCIPDRKDKSCNIDSVYLYLIEGTTISNIKEKEIFLKNYGHFKELESQAIVFSMIDNHTYDFRFKKFIIINFAETKKNGNQKIGRLLPPYITRIQQKFSLYIQRQGMPRIPNIFKK